MRESCLVHHMLHATADRRPASVAVVHGDERLTYDELRERTNRLASGFREAGVLPGDRVGVFLEPSVAQVVSILAISQAGGVFVPVHPRLKRRQVGHIVRDCQMKGIVTDSRRLEMMARDPGDELPLGFAIATDGGVVQGIGFPVERFDALLQRPVAHLVPDVRCEHDLAALIYTSGSTGQAKGVMLSHGNIVAGARIVAEYLDITPDDRTLAALPFSFDAGLNQLMTAMLQGAKLVLINFLFAKDIVRALRRERITGLAGVPTLWSLMADPTSTLVRHTFPDLRYVTNTGGVVPGHVLATLRAALPTTRFFLMYGLTEAFRSTYLPPEEIDRRFGSIGRAIPETEILVINDAGQLCAPGEVGELVHSGPTVALGYWGQPERSEKVWRPHPLWSDRPGAPPTVCYSGDLVKADDAGFLYFVGRRDNLIKSSGFRVSPTEVEEILCRGDGVGAAAVIGLPHEILGQEIKAFVTQRNGRIDTKVLARFCASQMPRHMVPASIAVVESLPTMGNGKVDYVALRELARSDGQSRV